MLQKITDKFTVFLLSKLPGFNLLDGKKRWIGNILLFIGGVLELFNQYFEWSLANQAEGILVAISGFIVKVIGDFHKDAKERLKIG